MLLKVSTIEIVNTTGTVLDHLRTAMMNQMERLAAAKVAERQAASSVMSHFGIAVSEAALPVTVMDMCRDQITCIQSNIVLLEAYFDDLVSLDDLSGSSDIPEKVAALIVPFLADACLNLRSPKERDLFSR